jgi:DUF4097 and DUF4098 domain-containing protein YvlB
MAGTARADDIRQRSTFVRDADGVEVLRVENARGVVDVRPSDDGRLHIEAIKIAHSPSPSVTRELSEKTVVETDQFGGTFRIRVRYPSHKVNISLWNDLSTDHLPGVEVQLAIEIPAHLAVELSTASGKILTYGLGGRQTLKSASGLVQAESAKGSVSVTSSSGNVETIDVKSAVLSTSSGRVSCDVVRGPLSVTTSSGDVTIQGAQDSVRIRTTVGDIKLARAPRGLDLRTTAGEAEVGAVSGRIRMNSTSGDLAVRLASPMTGAEIETSSGRVTVQLDPQVACAVLASSTSGEIDFRLPVQTRTLSRGQVSAVVRGGSAPVNVRSVSGDIYVTGGGRR